MEYSESPHRPLHIYSNDTWYFITASTAKRARYLLTNQHLQIWREQFIKTMAELHLEPSAWVILANHYHLLVHVHQRHGLGQLVKLLHGRTSHQINQLDNAQGRQLWYSYWDRCIRSDHDFWTRFNYIHYNPVKHGYVENPEDWEYSSYSFYIREQGQEWLAKAWLDYPADTLMQEDKY